MAAVVEQKEACPLEKAGRTAYYSSSAYLYPVAQMAEEQLASN